MDKSSLFFTRTALAIDYWQIAPKPERWLKFLQEVLGDDALIDFMQQAIGYIIGGDTSLQTIVYFRGRSRSGKGTIMKVLDGLVGGDNIANPSLRDLSLDFGRQDLIGKTLAMVSRHEHRRQEQRKPRRNTSGQHLSGRTCDRLSQVQGRMERRA